MKRTPPITPPTMAAVLSATEKGYSNRVSSYIQYNFTYFTMLHPQAFPTLLATCSCMQNMAAQSECQHHWLHPPLALPIILCCIPIPLKLGMGQRMTLWADFTVQPGGYRQLTAGELARNYCWQTLQASKLNYMTLTAQNDKYLFILS